MREMFKMIIVLTILSSFSGGLLAALRDGTKDRIENQELELVKGPAVRSILYGCSNDPINDRVKIMDGEVERSIFVGSFGGEFNSVAFEMIGSGFADKFGMVIAINLQSDKIIGVGITTHKETPGLGAKAKEDPSFTAQFNNIDSSDNSKILLNKDGGCINAISGATVTSRAVCNTVNEATKKYRELKSDFIKSIEKII